MLATFNGTWDWTAVGTLALAVVTGISLAFGWRSLRQGQREVEEAHRPVVVPVTDSREMEFAAGLSKRITSLAKPRMTEVDTLNVPVENVGSGPALQLEATITQWLTESGEWSAFGPGPQRSALVAGLGIGVLMPLEIKLHGVRGVSGFWLALTYSDVAGKRWITKARYVPDRRRYEDVTIHTHAEAT